MMESTARKLTIKDYIDRVNDNINSIKNSGIKVEDEFYDKLQNTISSNVISLAEVRGGSEESLLRYIDEKTKNIDSSSNQDNNNNDESEKLDNIIKFTDIMSKDISEYGKGTMNLISEFGSNIVSTLVEGFSNLEKILLSVSANFSDSIGTLKNGLASKLSEISLTTSSIKEDTKEKEDNEKDENKDPKSNPLSLVLSKAIGTLTKNLSSVTKAIYDLPMLVVDMVTDFIETVVAVFIALRIIIPNLIASIFGEDSTVYKFIMKAFELQDKILEGAGKLIKFLGKLIVGLVQNILDGFVAIWDGMKIVFKGIVTGLKVAWNAIINLPENVMTIFRFIGNKVGNFLGSIWNAVKSVFRSILELPKKAFSSLWELLKSGLSHLPIVGKYFKDDKKDENPNAEVSGTQVDENNKIISVDGVPVTYVNSYESSMTKKPVSSEDEIIATSNLAATAQTYQMMNSQTERIVESNNSINNSTKEVVQSTNEISINIENMDNKYKPSVTAESAPYFTNSKLF